MKREMRARPKNAADDPETNVKMPEGMTAAKSRDGKVSIGLPARSDRNVFKPLGGSESHEFNITLLREVLGCLWVTRSESDTDASARVTAAAAEALRAFKPADEIEGMLAAQAVALHFGSMECFRRSMLPEQPSDIANKLRRDGANMARGMTDMIEALDRKRGKGPQVFRVERVVVQEGAQAIVGNVQSAATAKSASAARPPPRAIEQAAPRMTLDGVASPEMAPIVARQARGEG